MSSSVLDLRQTIVEQALRDAALYKAVLDQLEPGIYIVDRDRRILYWNAAAERISGYLEHEVSGRFCQGNLLMHCDGEGEILCGKQCPLSAVMHDCQPRECTIFLRHREGHMVRVQVRSRPIFNSQGAAVGAVEIFQEAGAGGRRDLPEPLFRIGTSIRAESGAQCCWSRSTR